MRPAIVRRGACAVALAAVAVPFAFPAAAAAQQAATPRDTLRLGELQAQAVRRDPRGGQVELLSAQDELRRRDLDAERLPALALSAQGQYQSDVVTLPFQLPGGVAVPAPPHESYDTHVAARQALYDPTRAARREVDRARLAESQARVRASLFALRQNVNDAYFTVLLMDAQRAEVETGLADLEAQLATVRHRQREGTALPSEAATLEVELLRRRQSVAELTASRGAALVVLGQLAGREVAASDALELPDLRAEVAQARAALDELRSRPEYEQFARSRELLGRQRAVVAARERPRLSAFGRAGYGRPGLNPLATDFDAYWLAGVQVEWAPWTWGAPEREREQLALQEQIVATEEAAFSEGVRRSVAADLATIDRLEGTLAADDEIIAKRQDVLRETRLRFGEGVITSAEYVDRETDLLAARLARASHRVELARSRARFLTLVGVEVR